MSNSKNLRLLALAALLILFALPAMSSLTQLSSNHSLFPNVHPAAGVSVPNVLGLDCAYGSNLEGSAFPTSITTSAPYSGPDFDGTLDSSCQATYLGDTDGVIHPLVEDNPTAIVAAGAGGGLTIDVVASLNSTTTINGFDISVKYDSHYVSAAIIDQSGLIWGGTGLPVGAFVLTLAKTIDNVNGVARVAQVLVGAPQQSGSSELFRVRFDLVGATLSTPVQIVSDTLTNPGNVQHSTNPATNIDTTSIYNVLNAGAVLNAVASWTFSPNPEVPLSPLTFTAAATCPGCTAPFAFSWDFSSNDAPSYLAKVQATTNPATITPPPPVVNRVTVTISDAAAHSFAITRVLPLVSKESPASTTVARKALTSTFAGQWLGGVTTANAAYTGSWIFCPGSALNKAVCSNPTVSFSQTPATVTQTNTQPALSYNYAGVYNNTFRVADTAEQQVGTLPTGNVALINFLITVTGTPRAYNVNVSGNTTSVNPGQAINFTAFSSYTLNYTTSRSNTFKYAWDFGDSSPTVTTNGNVTSVVHTYTVVGPHTVTVTATETANAAVSHIIETGTLAITVNSGAFTYGIAGPATGTVGTAVTFTGTTSGGTAPFTFTWNFGDGTGNINTGATASATHTYNTKGTFTVHGNATDSTAKVAQAPAQTISISPLTLAVSFTTAPTTGTVGTAVSFTATASGGTTPYSFSWSFGDGSAKVAGGATNPNTQSHTYNVKGTFTVKVNVTDANAKLATASATITIAPLTLAVSFTTAPTTGTVGTAVSFTANASGGTTPYAFSWNFGDGTANVAGGATNPNSQSHTYNVKGTFTVKVNVTDANAKLATVSSTITIAGTPLTVSFTTAPTTGTVGTSVSFTAQATGDTAPYTFSWSFGDGSAKVAGGTTNPNTQSHTYNTKGTFTVKVNATSANAKLATATATITISGTALVLTFTTAPTTGTVGTAVSFTASASGDTAPYTFSWNFGDGTANVAGGTTNPNTQSHTYNVKGTYTVKVNATSANAKLATATATITIAPLTLTVSFTTAPTTGTVGTSVSFTANAAGGTTPYSFSWSFGDGSAKVAGGATNPNTQSHTYNVKGTFTVKVNVTDANAKLATASATITIAPITLAVAFTVAPTTGTAGTAVSFTANASGGTTPYAFSWNFGDGTANVAGGATNPNSQSHTYNVKGTFTVKVNVTDANAKLATATSSITITGTALTVAFTVAPTTGTVGTSVSFTAQAAGDTAPYTFSWSFGDGSAKVAGGTTNPNTQSHTYNAKGTFTVKVNATSANAKLATATATITISPITLAVSFTTAPTTGTVGTSVSFTASASGGTTPYAFSWSFGDGSAKVAGGATNPNTQSHTYNTKGTFVVKVNVTDANAKLATASSSIAIVGTPLTLAFTTAPTTGTVGTSVSFTAQAAGDTAPYTFSWNFGDGTANVSGGTTNPNTQSHTYNNKGTFTVKVNVTDANGAKQTASSVITISPLTLAVSFTTAPTTGTTGTAVSFTASASGGTTPYAFSWNFGDGTANVAGGATNPNTQSHTYNVKGTFTVKVNVTDANAKLATATSSITITGTALTVAFTVAPSTGTVGTSISFTAQAAGDTVPYTFSWSFGDGSAKVAGGTTNPNTQPHTYNVKGTYTVRVNATSANAKLATATATITISPLTLAVSFTTAPTTGTVGTAVSFTASASGGTTPYAFSWNFGDGTSNVAGGATNPNTQSHTYNTKGTFVVKVNVTDANAKLAAASSSIAITGTPLTLAFTTAPTTGTVGTSVSFTAQAAGDTAPYTFSWSFGDGTANVAGGTTNPNTQSHTYNNKGTFTVKVNVTDANGAKQTASSVITIAPLALAVAFTTHPTTGSTGTAVSFTAQASGGTTPYSFSWSFGDGSAKVAGGATNPNTQSHTYVTKGTFTVTVNVTDANAKLATTTASITISAAPLTASFTVSANPTVGSPVTFTATVSGGTTPYSYTWNFGDGSALGTGNPVQHTYTTKGSKTVSLTVTDANAATAPSSQVITVAPITLAVSFTTAPTTGTVGSSVSFTVTASGGTTPYAFSWNFGDGSGNQAGGATNPNTLSHTYNTKGTFVVKVNVTDSNAKLASASSSIAITGTPLTLTFNTAPTTGTVGTSVSFTVTAAGDTAPYTFSWNFGDGTANVAGGTTNPNTQAHTYNNKGTFTVKVNVTDANGAKQTASSVITISPITLAIAFTVAPTTGTVGTSVSFTANASGGTTPYAFSWSFGDGSAKVAGGATNPNTQSHTYNTKGTFVVKVNVTDANAKLATATSSITITGTALTVAFTVAPTTGTVGTSVSFTAQAAGDTAPYAFSWSFGDGSANVAGGSTNPNTQSHTYNTKGTFTVKVNATSANAKLATATATITIAPLALTVSFTTAPTSGSTGTPVSFTAQASGGTTPYSFSWSFGDGSAKVAGGATNPNTQSHTYATAGTFTVKVNVTDANAKLATASTTITITALAVTFTVAPTTGTVGTSVSFTAQATGGTPPITFSWSFGDGTANVAGGTANPNTQSHTYNTKGTFTVKVNATDASSRLASASTSITITGTPLTLSFSTAPTTGTVGTVVSFTAQAAGDTAPYTFSWNFGDGTANVAGGTTNPNTQSHSYNNKGTFTVKVNVTDANGAKQTASSSITISPLALAVSFTSAPTTGTAGTSVSFTASASGGTAPYTFSWSFGDGSAKVAGGTVNPNTQSHTYNTKGTFTVTVNVTDANAKLATKTSVITITGTALTVAFTTAPTTGTVGTSVSFTANASGDTAPYTFSWSFGDGTANVAGGTTNPNTQSHTYNAKGTFTVKVNVTSANGKFATASSTITIAPLALTVSFTTAPTSGTVGTQVSFTAQASGGTAPYSFSWSFGDGTAKVAGGTTNPNTQSHTYATKGSFTVKVNATDTNAKIASASTSIAITGTALVVTFNTAPTSGSVGTAVSFTATASGDTAPYTFSWNFGDGTANVAGGTTNPNTQSHTYQVKGSFTVKVNVTDANGAKQTASSTIAITPRPLTVTFTVSANPTVGSPVTFTATATGGTAPYSFSWNFGDGSILANGAQVMHTYAAKGTFSVSVTVTDGNGASNNAGQSVTVAPKALTASFTFSPTNPAAGQQVTFTATVSGGTTPYSYLWSFGDGSFATTNPASHIYNTANTYNVRLNVTDANGVRVTTSQSVLVSGTTLTVDFTFSPSSPTVGQTVTFTATSTGGTAPVTFAWNFGDGSTGSGNPATHSYSVKGTFTVTVTGTDAAAKTASATHSVTVTPLALTADFSFMPAAPSTGQSVTFTATVSGGTAPYSYAWNFGDGTTGSTNPASHSYSTKGTFIVTLTVTDTNGKTATASHSVTVTPLTLTADFTFSPTSPRTNQQVTFTATVSGGTTPYSYSWNFGDGSTGTSNPATHTYTAPNTYTVTLTVTDGNGKTATASHMITVTTVTQQLTADFGPTNTLVGDTTFVAVISGGTSPYTCVWSFGDGSAPQTGCSPVHTYIAAGSFTVTLTVTDSAASTATASHTVTVQAGPTVDIITFKSHPFFPAQEDFKIHFTNPSTISVNMTVTIDIFDSSGTVVQELTKTVTVGPGVQSKFDMLFTPTAKATYTFAASMTYQASLPVGAGTSQTTTVTGSNGSQSGTFAYR